jgi:hypothetical protein
VDDQSSLGPMFDSTRGSTPLPSRLLVALLLSVAAHLCLLVLAVTFGHPVPVAATPLPPLRAPRGGHGGGPVPVTPTAPPKQARTPVPQRKALRPPRPDVPPPELRPAAPTPIEAQATSSPAELAGAPGEGNDGPAGPGGCQGPLCGESGGGGEILSETVVAVLPLLLSGPPVRLPASAQGLSGTMRVVCVITVTGTVADCDVQQGAPLAEAAVLAALRSRTYRPAQLDGRPVAVHHVFQVPLGPAR